MQKTLGLTFILGGARSGKSAHAERLATLNEMPVTYIATAQVYDAEFEQRIAHHRKRRPMHWNLVEEPFFLAQALQQHAAPDTCVLVDCLTLWLAQWLCPDCNPPQNRAWESERQNLLDLLPTLPGSIILVSNEVGMGIVPLGEINRRFQDEQGRLNQDVAKRCDKAIFMAAGLPLLLK
ncbi:bifunctional adenosylcobalamin biosynthesis protein CobP [mine drainage metagenome]|uniref:Adenosylcobinamide kinase n=1 Tax=mine drainage metagenome TaxID=410659 RepID=A0A1J5QT72_9ZZZZ